MVEYWENASRLAFRFLEELELGSEIDGNIAMGKINFYDGLAPADDSQIVGVPDFLSLSFLQKRLNEIGGTVFHLTHWRIIMIKITYKVVNCDANGWGGSTYVNQQLSHTCDGYNEFSAKRMASRFIRMMNKSPIRS